MGIVPNVYPLLLARETRWLVYILHSLLTITVAIIVAVDTRKKGNILPTPIGQPFQITYVRILYVQNSLPPSKDYW